MVLYVSLVPCKKHREEAPAQKGPSHLTFPLWAPQGRQRTKILYALFLVGLSLQELSKVVGGRICNDKKEKEEEKKSRGFRKKKAI